MCVALKFGLVILLSCISIDGSKLPCFFFDSINITDGVHQSNNSILFDGIDFPSNQYAILDYIIDNGKRKATKSYFRGCLCRIKPCYRLCCLDELIIETTINLDNNCNEELSQMEGEVHDDKGLLINLYLAEPQTTVKNRTCKQFYIEEEITEQIENVIKL